MTRERLHDDLLMGAVFVLLSVGLFYAPSAPMPPVKASNAPRTELTVYRAGVWDAPIVKYDPQTETLTVTEHAPRSLLICLGTVCDLRDGWRQK